MRQHGSPQQGLEAEKAERRRMRRMKIDEAFDKLRGLMHEVEGTVSGDYSTREMRIAGEHLETAWLWALEAIEE